MRFPAFLACLLLAACAPNYLSASNEPTGGNDTDLGNYAGDVGGPPPSKFDPANSPPQCDPTKDFPGGKVPDNFLVNYVGPEADKYVACVWADAKSKAKGVDLLVYFGESQLKTECSAGDQYPDRKIQPGFYAYPEAPEYKRYLECVLAEAQRDGEIKRLASDKSFPKVGTCYRTKVTEIGTRWGDGKPSRDSGTTIGFANKLWLVDYGLIRQVGRSRMGDPVRACVHELPEDCPADDLRGIGYRVRNLRTDEVFTMYDSQHMCRGA